MPCSTSRAGVRADIVEARRLLVPQGVVIFDDIAQARHAPGVAAAVWEAVATGGLIPLGITANKLIATWNADPAMLHQLEDVLETSGFVDIVDRHFVHGHEVLELHPRPTQARTSADGAAAEDGAPAPSFQRFVPLRRLARRRLPPVMFDALVRLRDHVVRASAPISRR